jgi:hypothetical protein
MSEGVHPVFQLQDANDDHENPSGSESEDSDTSDSSDDVSNDSPMEIDSDSDSNAEDDSDSDPEMELFENGRWRPIRTTGQFERHANLSDMLLKLKSYASV